MRFQTTEQGIGPGPIGAVRSADHWEELSSRFVEVNLLNFCFMTPVVFCFTFKGSWYKIKLSLPGCVQLSLHIIYYWSLCYKPFFFIFITVYNIKHNIIELVEEYNRQLFTIIYIVNIKFNHIFKLSIIWDSRFYHLRNRDPPNGSECPCNSSFISSSERRWSRRHFLDWLSSWSFYWGSNESCSFTRSIMWQFEMNVNSRPDQFICFNLKT